MKAFFLTSSLLLVTSLQTMGQPMPETKPKPTVTQSTEPKTISDVVTEVREIMKEIKLQFHPGTKDEDIIFGLQHTIADYRANDADKGKPFPVTVESLSKISNYYRAMVATIKDNKSDVDILPLFVDALQDMSISGEESKYLMQSMRAILTKNNLDSRGVIKLENRDDHPTEVNQDPRLLAKDKDGMNEGIAFKMDGKEKVFMKQYLASLLEPINEPTLEAIQLGSNVDNNKTLPQATGADARTKSIVKNN